MPHSGALLDPRDPKPNRRLWLFALRQIFFGSGEFKPFVCHGRDLGSDLRVYTFLRQPHQAFALATAELNFVPGHDWALGSGTVPISGAGRG